MTDFDDGRVADWRTLGRWSAEVSSDKTVSHARARTAGALSSFANPKHSWVVWPSSSTLSTRTGIAKVKDVQTHVAGLRAAGYLTYETTPKRGQTVRHVLTFPAQSAPSDGGHSTGSEPVPSTPECPVSEGVGAPSETGHSAPSDGGPSSHPDQGGMTTTDGAPSNRETDDAAPVAGAPGPVVLRGRVRPPMEGHGRVVVDSGVDVFPTEALGVLARAARDVVRHADCPVTFCGRVETRDGLAVVGAPPEAVGGLVDAFRSVGVLVETANA